MVRLACSVPLVPRRSSSADLAAVGPQQAESCSVPLGPRRFQWGHSSSACVARAFQHWATVLKLEGSSSGPPGPGSQEAPCGVPFVFCPRSLRWRNIQTGRFIPTPPDSVLTPHERAYVRECKAAKAAAASERNQRRSSPTKQASRAELKQADPQPEPEEL